MRIYGAFMATECKQGGNALIELRAKNRINE